MDKSEAIRLCCEYLNRFIEIEECDYLPSGLYHFNPSDDYLFIVRFHARSPFIDSNPYISISKATGVVKFLGLLESYFCCFYTCYLNPTCTCINTPSIAKAYSNPTT